jgi:hypothetical protein
MPTEVTIIRDDAGLIIGRVTKMNTTYRAARRWCDPLKDLRRVGYGFRTVETATAWILKGTPGEA